jgi:hypothetical protein
MKIIKKLSLFIAIASTVGIAYAMYTLKNMPDVFDFTLDGDEDDREV